MKKKTILLLSLLIFAGTTFSQKHPDFEITKYVKTTPVKNQGRTGTCWSFATTSFIETEAIRMNKPAFDLSEMYIVKNVYLEKAKRYVRMQGKNNFAEGGQAHDVMNAIIKYGLVPESIYSGLNYGSTMHNHSEMFGLLDGMLESVTKSKYPPKQPIWQTVFNSTVEQFLGKNPNQVSYEGKNYSPKDFAKKVVGINPDDYVEFTSFECYPYNTAVELEVPDNWSHDLYYNVTAEDIIRIMDNAISKGYSVCWDGDTSEKNFKHGEGKAILSPEESGGILSDGIEKMRQKTFDNFTTTDDHLMHIVGLAKDNNNTQFYLTKNSWGDASNKYGGYLYMSKWYVQLKTIAILVHKNALPKDIRRKIKLR